MFSNRHALLIASLFLLLVPRSAPAFGIDLLGDLAQPLIGPTKEKIKNSLVYIWLQPYAGYGTGTSDQSRRTVNGVVTTAKDLSLSGFVFGGRGGFIIKQTFRVGIDFSSQSIKRNTLLETSRETYIQGPVNSKNTLVGAILGIDLPYTPLQGYATRYFNASLSGDAASDGDGWGFGVSFVLKNPFFVSLEKRTLTYTSGPSVGGKSAEGKVDQIYLTLGFMLF